MALTYLSPGDNNALRVTNAINKNADEIATISASARDYRYITEAVGAAEDYGSIT